MKVVINAKFGGFSLSRAAAERLAELGFEPAATELSERLKMGPDSPLARLTRDSYLSRRVKRNDPLLVKVVEELGEAASGCHAKLKIVEVPDDAKWTIEEYDGNEWVAEEHRRWE